MRQQLLDAIYAGQPFRTVLRDLGLTSNEVWGLTRTDQEWSKRLETALTAARRNALRHGTNAAYVHGCVCSECREHRLVRRILRQISANAIFWAPARLNRHSGLDTAWQVQ
jgi:hypothetical protein